MNYGRYHDRPPCANCGKKPGIMGSTSWGHGHMCCSEACGKRLAQRIQNGMVHLDPDPYDRFNLFGNRDESRIERLRERIKHLEKQLKVAGVKPKKMVI